MSRSSSISFEVWIPIVLLSAGLIWFLVIPSWRNIRGALEAAEWPQASATVIRAKAIESYSQERRHTIYDFRYRYRVGDREFTNSRYSFRFASGDQRSAVKKYSAGAEITVYYDPDDPSQSVVDRDSSAWWNYLVLSTIVLLPIAFLMRWRSVMRR